MSEFFNPVPKPEPKVKTKPKPPNPINSERVAERYEKNFGGKAYRDLITSMPCAICGIEGLSDPAHLKTRGSGGTAADLVPLCQNRYGVLGCHFKFDDYQEEARRHESRLRRLAKTLWKEWERTQKTNHRSSDR